MNSRTENLNAEVVLPKAGITGLLVNNEWRTPAKGKTLDVEKVKKRLMFAAAQVAPSGLIHDLQIEVVQKRI